MTDSNTGAGAAGAAPPKELVLTRVFDAPRELVFKAWTDPRHVAEWWGPHGFTNPVCELDARPGGAILIHMLWPDGSTVNPMRGVYHEIVEPERLVFTSTAMEDEQGKPGLEVLNTVTFAEDNGKTRMTLHALVVKAAPETAAALAGMEQGWTESLERLSAYVVSAHRHGAA
ncbi:MAG TPA: SRPBCC domain-containing protein [Dehalococcoidia bacterium]|nr:SRPBCC domain-containing protein [Dehalococcoidia bacterium]